MKEKPEYISGWQAVLPEGRSIGTSYDSKNDGFILYFSKRLTPELMGEHRSLETLNKEQKTNFELSKNKKSVETYVTLSTEAAMVLRGLLGKTLHSSRKEIRKNAMRKMKEDLVTQAGAYLSTKELEGY